MRKRLVGKNGQGREGNDRKEGIEQKINVHTHI